MTDDRFESDPRKETVLGAGEDRSPKTIGNYRLLQKIGDGGMGEVYRAEQQKPFKRVVALKLIKRGMDSERVLARFESERQALALMDHTNIAKVFDAGLTEGGRPYFVMEHVKGIPVDEYCEKNSLTVRERLELFVEICNGVHHAHQKGIIHRDVKGSNVLVTLQDGKPTPKIIDFGVAKATDRPLTERAEFTQIGQLLGTPEYMSPEQAELTGLDIDTRTDVYSLGVLLYELLVGRLPFDVSGSVPSGISEMLRKIREEEATKPSTRISAGGPDTARVAEKRRTDRSSLARRLRGDLDWIVMKALEKDRIRRYASVSEFAADISRHLKHEPVQAGPPSTLYVLGKYVRRHKAAVVFATSFVLLLVAFSAAMAVQLGQTREARDLARQEAASFREIADFLEGLFQVPAPSVSRGNTITAREILDRGAERIERELQGQPLAQARLMGTMGRVYESLGLYRVALPLYQRSLDLRQRHPEGAVVDKIVSMVDLAQGYYQLGSYDEAAIQYQEAREIGESSIFETHPELEARCLLGLGRVYFKRGEYEKTRPLFTRGLELRRRFGANGPALAGAMRSRANLHRQYKEFDEARLLYEQARAINERVFGTEAFEVAEDMIGLGNVHFDLGTVHRDPAEYEHARELFERALELKKKVFPDDSPDLSTVRNNLASCYKVLKQDEKVRSIYEQVLENEIKARHKDHPHVAAPHRNLGLVLIKLGEQDAAGRHLERALEIRKKHRKPNHWEIGQSLDNLAMWHIGKENLGKAADYFREALGVWEARKEDLRAAKSLYNLACIASRRGELRESLRLLTDAIDRGYDPRDLANDEWLAPLADDPGFRALVRRVEERRARAPGE